jgi:hypothetical protein
MGYKIFKRLSQQFFNKKISRGVFLVDWKTEQKRQGITPPAWAREGSRKQGA